jgi:hypothetical protein
MILSYRDERKFARRTTVDKHNYHNEELPRGMFKCDAAFWAETTRRIINRSRRIQGKPLMTAAEFAQIARRRKEELRG